MLIRGGGRWDQRGNYQSASVITSNCMAAVWKVRNRDLVGELQRIRPYLIIEMVDKATDRRV